MIERWVVGKKKKKWSAGNDNVEKVKEVSVMRDDNRIYNKKNIIHNICK